METDQSPLGRKKRRHPRLPSTITVHISTPGSGRRIGFSVARDVSLGGIAVRSDGISLPIGAKVDLRLVLSTDTEYILTSGKVVHCTQGVGIGIEMDPMDENEAQKLQSFIEFLSE